MKRLIQDGSIYVLMPHLKRENSPRQRLGVATFPKVISSPTCKGQGLRIAHDIQDSAAQVFVVDCFYPCVDLSACRAKTSTSFLGWIMYRENAIVAGEVTLTPSPLKALAIGTVPRQESGCVRVSRRRQQGVATNISRLSPTLVQEGEVFTTCFIPREIGESDRPDLTSVVVAILGIQAWMIPPRQLR